MKCDNANYVPRPEQHYVAIFDEFQKCAANEKRLRNTELDVENCLRNVLFRMIFEVQSFYFFSQCGFNSRKKYTLFIKICKDDCLYYQETERNSMSLNHMLKVV